MNTTEIDQTVQLLSMENHVLHSLSQLPGGIGDALTIWEAVERLRPIHEETEAIREALSEAARVARSLGEYLESENKQHAYHSATVAWLMFRHKWKAVCTPEIH